MRLIVGLLMFFLACNPAQQRRSDAGPTPDSGLVLEAAVRCTAPDADGDGLCDEEERVLGSDPNQRDTDGDGLDDLAERNVGSNPRVADTDSDGISDADEVFLGSNPILMDDACAQSQAQTKQISRPVDIIVVIDNNTSITTKIESVRNNINQNLASIIGASNVDYRIIMLTRHVASAGAYLGVCISTPLSGHSCSPAPTRPVNTSRFYHYDIDIDSTDSLSKIIRTYRTRDRNGNAPNGWQPWLRANAFKVFIEFTDDNSGLSASSFDAMLTSLDSAQFGTPENRNYTFHSIVGLTPKSTPAEAYQPGEPIQRTKCPGAGQAVNHSQVYQELSRTTGGLRFPLCRPDLYDVIFRTVAMGVIQGAALPCSFALPTSNGQPVDASRILLRYTSGAGMRYPLGQVSSAASCVVGGWYLDATQQIRLCPESCALAMSDPMASVRILAACDIRLD